MASWRVVALVGLGALGAVGCGSKSTSGDDDSGGKSGSGASSSGGSSGSSGSSASGGSGAIVGAGATDGSGGFATLPKACGSLTSADARRIATMNIASVLHAAVADAQFTEGSTLLARGQNAGQATSDPFKFADDANKSIDDFVDDLNKNVFPDANVETSTDDSVTFHPTPDVNCPLDQELAMEDPELAQQDRQDCIDNLTMPVERWVVSRVDCDHGDVVTISLEVGDDRSVPGFVTAAPATLALSMDFAATASAVQAQGPTDESESAAGSVVFVLDTSTTGVATFTGSLAGGSGAGNQVTLDETDDEGNHVHATLAPTADAVKVTSDSNKQTFTGSLDIGALSVLFPLHSFVESAFSRSVSSSVTNAEGVTLNVPGVTGGFEYDRVADTLKLTDLSLGMGTTTVKTDTATLLTVDVNPASGRSLDAALAFDANGELQVSPTPGFDLELGYSMKSVANVIQDLEAFANDDTVGIQLSGSSPMATLVKDFDGNLALTSREDGAAMRVTAGNFAMTSKTFASESVLVAAGQCLLYAANRSGQHDILRGYYAGNCP